MKVVTSTVLIFSFFDTFNTFSTNSVFPECEIPNTTSPSLMFARIAAAEFISQAEYAFIPTRLNLISASLQTIYEVPTPKKAIFSALFIAVTTFVTSEYFKLISQSENIFTKRTKNDINYKSYNKFDDWGYFDISKVDIQYYDQFEIHQWQDKGNGLVKEEKYSWEEETRIRVAMDPLGWENILNDSNKFEVVRPFFETLYMQLSEAMLKSMYISVPERASEEFILKVKSILDACEHTNNCPIYRLCENGELEV